MATPSLAVSLPGFPFQLAQKDRAGVFSSLLALQSLSQESWFLAPLYPDITDLLISLKASYISRN